MGYVVETGCLSQWLHFSLPMHYARWAAKRQEEVDFVLLNERLQPAFALEVKWSDTAVQRPERELRTLLDFARTNRLDAVAVTTRTVERIDVLGNVTLLAVPAALYCHTVGRNLVKNGWNVRQIFRDPPSDSPSKAPFE